MRISKKLLVCFFSTVLCFQYFYQEICAAPKDPGAPLTQQLPQMSNEEMALTQQLDSVFEELTKGMSEDEKKNFFNELNTAMEEEIDKMSKMSEEELTKYIQDAEKELQDLGAWQEPQTQNPPVQVTQPEPVHPTPAPVVEEIKKPSRDMAPTLDEIAARLDSFIQKANQIVEMAANFEKWGKKGKLHGWNPTMTWAVFKEKIEALKKKVLEIKSLDPKTQRPKYLVDLTANEPLCNNLNQFKTVLAKHEPDVQVPSFGLKKISKSSKKAFVAIINDCLEALLALNIPAELDKIIVKYEPTAKKLKEAEEKAQQTALEASKRHPIRPSSMTTTAKGREEAGYYQQGLPGEKTGYPMYMPTQPYMPEKIGEYEGGKGKEEGKNKFDEKGEKPKKDEKDIKPGPSSKKEDVKETEATKAIDRASGDFIEQLEDAREDMELNLNNMQTRAKSQDIKKLRELEGAIKNCTMKVNIAHKTLKKANDRISRLDKGPQKEKFIKSFHEAWAGVARDFTHWQDIAQRTAL